MGVNMEIQEAIYKEIEGRHTHQQWLIRVVDALVALSLVITTVLVLRYSGAL